MTTPSHRRQNAGVRRLVAGALTGTAVALSVGLGIGAGSAHASDIIDTLAAEYSLGTSGGQVSNLLNQVVSLRNQGIAPKAADLVVVEDSLRFRPNQLRLIQALSATLANQRNVQSRMSGQNGQGQPGVGVGVNMEPWNPGGNPMVDGDAIFPMPGRS